MKVVLGITGSIAAYKAAGLCRLLVQRGDEVRVVMTPLAKQFITPLTMATLSKNPIAVEFFDPENGAWNSHVALGEWADCLLIAPATANTLAKMAHGVADNLLLTTYLSAKCSVVVAPAMDLDMYRHAATQENLEVLRARGVQIIEPAEGELASGLVGKGRMAEPEVICDFLLKKKSPAGTLRGKKFLVTAGPTQEAIDPVRYISNHSTGKMGYALAGELARRGAEVTLISGPTQLAVPMGVRRVDVVSAEQMYDASVREFDSSDGAILCAAVADYTPETVSATKIKKSADQSDLHLNLRPTVDIAASLGALRQGRNRDKILVGFALETDHETENARVKLDRKGLDFIVLNSLRDSGAGFGHDTNRITLIDRQSVTPLPLMSKSEAAARIIDKIEKLF